MPNIASLLKSEITRLARKEVRQQIATVRNASATHRRQIASLRRQLATLERETTRLRRSTKQPSASAAPEGEDRRIRFVAKGLRTLRARLGLSAEEFGRLVGVSGQSVYNWERRKAIPRRTQVKAIADLRPLGKREARAKLDEMSAAASRRGKAK